MPGVDSGPVRTCWYLDRRCPLCLATLATNGRTVWCTRGPGADAADKGCGYFEAVQDPKGERP